MCNNADWEALACQEAVKLTVALYPSCTDTNSGSIVLVPVLVSNVALLISGADLYSMYVGEGEALLRDTFRQARLAAPSIIFFDEADAVASRRFYTPLLYIGVTIGTSSLFHLESRGFDQPTVIY